MWFVTHIRRVRVLVVKLYLMTTSCSGKSYFVRDNPTYGGLEIVDFSKVNRPASEGHEPEATLAPGTNYRERVISYLRGRDGQVCVLGRRGPEDPPLDASITYAAVVLPESEHTRNWEARRAKRPHTRWKTFADLERKRDKLRAYADLNDFPVFESFTSAIDHYTTR